MPNSRAITEIESLGEFSNGTSEENYSGINSSLWGHDSQRLPQRLLSDTAATAHLTPRRSQVLSCLSQIVAVAGCPVHNIRYFRSWHNLALMVALPLAVRLPAILLCSALITLFLRS
jgi:hypothetical protein